MLDNTTNQLSKFNAKNLFQINDESQGTHDKDNQNRFKTLKPSIKVNFMWL